LAAKPLLRTSKDAPVTAQNNLILSCLLALASVGAANGQDISTVAKVSAGTAAITAAVVLLHGHSSAPTTSSTSSANSPANSSNSITAVDIGRGGNNAATFAGYGNNGSTGGATNGNGPLASGGAAGIQTAAGGLSSSLYKVANDGPAIIFRIQSDYLDRRSAVSELRIELHHRVFAFL
jgi:hypothetical protein